MKIIISVASKIITICMTVTFTNIFTFDPIYHQHFIWIIIINIIQIERQLSFSLHSEVDGLGQNFCPLGGKKAKCALRAKKMRQSALVNTVN